MKSRPQVSATGELAFKIEPQHAIDFAADGMPAVLSTPNLIGFLERTAREIPAGCLEDDERSVGVEIELRHLAPTPVGQTIHCSARVIHAGNREVTFQIRVVVGGQLEYATVNSVEAARLNFVDATC